VPELTQGTVSNLC